MNLNVESGSYVGIFGSTGTGKSTLVQLLARLYDTTSGEVIVGGKNVKHYGLEGIKKRSYFSTSKECII